MLQLAAVAAAGAFFGVALLRVVVAGAVVFAVLRLVVLAVGWLAFVAATLRVERGISDPALVARSPRLGLLNRGSGWVVRRGRKYCGDFSTNRQWTIENTHTDTRARARTHSGRHAVGQPRSHQSVHAAPPDFMWRRSSGPGVRNARARPRR